MPASPVLAAPAALRPAAPSRRLPLPPRRLTPPPRPSSYAAAFDSWDAADDGRDLVLSCDGCPVAATAACDDCIVPLLCTSGALSGTDAQGVVALQEAGLVPRSANPPHQQRLVLLSGTPA